MQTVIDDFNQRKIEVNKYFDFIEKIESDYRLLNSMQAGLPTYRVDDEHLKIFKANGFLILYNLIESTILNSVVSIFDEIKVKQIGNKRVSYTDVTEQIKKYWLKSKYNHGERIKKDTVVNQFYALCEDITTNISLELEKDSIEFNGNLTAYQIRDIATSLGITLTDIHYKNHLHGQALRDIKKHRNDLAHGVKSFSAIGKDVTYVGDGQDGTRGLGLIHFKDYTIEHLESFIQDISDFIIQEKYLVAKTTP